MTCLMHLAPPIHGVTMMNEAIVKSDILRTAFRMEVIPLRFAVSISDIGSLRLRKLMRALAVAGRLALSLMTKRPDMGYITLTPTGVPFYRDLVYIAIFKAARVPRLFHLHGQGIRQAAERPLARCIYRWAFRGAKVILLSNCLYSDVSAVARREDCFIVPNGIEIPHTNDVGASRNKCDSPPHILFFSNMGMAKGPLVLLDALGRLKNNGIAFRAVFAGEWSSTDFREEFYERVRLRGLDEFIEYRGPQYGADKARLLEEADILAFPSLNEAFPLVVLEAMAHALPVVASDEGAIPEMVQNGETGFLITKGADRALADRLDQLLRDADLRTRLGSAGRERFLRLFTIEVFEARLAAVLENCYQSLSKG